MSSQELRYPDGLVVSLDGSGAGSWFSFTEGVGGGPVQALQRTTKGLHFEDGLEMLREMAETLIMPEGDSSNRAKQSFRAEKIPPSSSSSSLKSKAKVQYNFEV